MAYEVTHRTVYHYPSTVSSSFGEIVMLPRDLAGQSCLRSELTIDPVPHDLRERLDFFGNRTAYFAVLAPHTRLSVTATSLVRVHDRQVRPSAESEQPWERARDGGSVADASVLDASVLDASVLDASVLDASVLDASVLDASVLDARQFVLDSPLVTISEQLAEYAAPSFPPGRPVLAAVVDLSSRIHRDFEFLPGVTEVKTTIEELFARRAGVCQDFAHVAIGCLRSLGLAARYVSGYLETRPPPGQARLAGADVSHAWVSVFIPGAGWADVDPTNDQLVNDRYVTTAWGRDYTDVPPAERRDLHPGQRPGPARQRRRHRGPGPGVGGSGPWVAGGMELAWHSGWRGTAAGVAQRLAWRG